MHMSFSNTSLVQLVKNPPAMQETPVQFLGQEEGKGYPLHCSGLENDGLYSPWHRKALDMTEQLSLSFTGLDRLNTSFN